MPGEPTTLTLDYVNHRGERGLRQLEPLEVWHGTSEFHDDEGWFLKAAAADRGGEVRDFALAGVVSWAADPALEGSAVQPGIYRHYKGPLYLLQAVGRHSETEEEHVVYRPLYGAFATWVRPAAMWSESVDTADGPRPRFAFVGPLTGPRVG